MVACCLSDGTQHETNFIIFFKKWDTNSSDVSSNYLADLAPKLTGTQSFELGRGSMSSTCKHHDNDECNLWS